jgi:predicted Rossmann fold nucleotide-binding protein DprA/Smf involved in DNA uptake
LLERLPASADELVRSSGCPAGVVAAALAELELAGLAAEGEGIYRALA